MALLLPFTYFFLTPSELLEVDLTIAQIHPIVCLGDHTECSGRLKALQLPVDDHGFGLALSEAMGKGTFATTHRGREVLLVIGCAAHELYLNSFRELCLEVNMTPERAGKFMTDRGLTTSETKVAA